MSRGVTAIQAVYFVTSGLWPIVHLRSFMAVTAPKHDTWLVRTFGALVAAIGLAMLGSRHEGHAAARIGFASALALALSEVVFVARRRISPVYLLDAILELGFAAKLGPVLVRAEGRPRRSGHPRR